MVTWEIYQNDDLVRQISSWSPIIELPAPGEYTVLLNVGGPGGVTAASLDIDTRTTQCGCNGTPAALGLLGLLGSLGMAVRRRRSAHQHPKFTTKAFGAS